MRRSLRFWRGLEMSDAYPRLGSDPNRTENKVISSMPSQNAGIAILMLANADRMRLNMERGLTTITRLAGTAIKRTISIAADASSIVGPMACPMRVDVGKSLK
jgi:hypothetical protein